jgi:hypothetical protein
MQYEFSNAYFFYGDRAVKLTGFLETPFLQGGGEDAFAVVTEDSVNIEKLAHLLARRSGDTLSPAEVMRRGSLKTTNPIEVDGRVIAPAFLVYHGSGFNVSWKAINAGEPQ